MASQTYYSAPLSPAEFNVAALEDFIYTPVRSHMIEYLACSAREVIRCDESMMPPPPSSSLSSSQTGNSRLPITPPRTPPPVASGDKFLPSLEQFIHNLVRESNVQVPTLMATLVYLNRLKSRLQPEAKGLRCTAHRIFLAALILTAKYLNDSSPKNKHWTRYTRIWDESKGSRYFYRAGRETERQPDFEFSNTEVNLMEKQLLQLLEWDLRISEDDLYRELNPFLDPFRRKIAAKHEQRMRKEAARIEEARRKAEEQKMAELWAAHAPTEYEGAASAPAGVSYGTYATPPSSPGQQHSRNGSRASSRQQTRYATTPESVPALSSSYGSTARSIGSSHSYAPSLASSRGSTGGATTPPSSNTDSLQDPYIYNGGLSAYSSSSIIDNAYDPPVEIIVAAAQQQQQKQQQTQQQQQNLQYYHGQELPQVPQLVKQKSLLPYEISPEELRELETGVVGAKRSRVRGMFGRIFSHGSGVAARA